MRSILVSLLLLAATTLTAKDEVYTVAVFNFETPDETIKDLGPKIATLLTANLSAEPQVITVERAELEKILGEQELGLSGTVSSDTAAKVGHLTGAKVLVTGKAFKVDRDLIMVAKIIGTETSRVFGEMVKSRNSTDITDLSGELAKKIAKILIEKGETLVPKLETREERIAKLRKKLGDGKLPAISVKIPEQHYGQPVRDPAAETELALALKDCGFTLVDDKSKEKASIEITGEAFSAYGMRKGNLISCKARIEIKAHDLESRKLLAQDRQTSVAVDIAEQTAAKTALQNAAFELAERLLPKLGK